MLFGPGSLPPEAKDVTGNGIFEISGHAFGFGFFQPKHISTSWHRFYLN